MTYEEQIKKSFPLWSDNEIAYLADFMAMKLVGERHGKRDLVDLVRWLIMGGAEVVRSDL